MKTRKKKHKYLWLFLIGFILIFHSDLLNVYNLLKTSSYINKISYNTIKKNENADGEFNFDNVKAVTSLEGLTTNTTNLPVIGGISIPELNLNLPIFKGLSNENLSMGAGTMKPEQKMGEKNYTLASHSIFYGFRSEELVFSPLRRAKKNQTIYLRDADFIYQYVITDIFTVYPQETWVLNDTPEQNTITLITCQDLAMTLRLVVKGSFVSKILINEAPQNIKDSFGVGWTSWKTY